MCRRYLSDGRRRGNYWKVGDVRNTAGRSMFVRLTGDVSGKRAAGKWTDAATGEHGDLLDVIRESCGLVDFHDVAEEARRFLKSPRARIVGPEPSTEPSSPAGSRSRHADCLHVTADCRYDRGSLSADRGITAWTTAVLRFHPRCYYRPVDSTRPRPGQR